MAFLVLAKLFIGLASVLRESILVAQLSQVEVSQPKFGKPSHSNAGRHTSIRSTEAD
ncbi:hypothetical protein VCR6J2_450040 [Vibrio coralliirubri]|nr:hypothetical protein VCR6J2_450040 [Vibrio coralliirubri]